MLYITNSNKKPIGDVDRFWYRFELQEKEANVPHIHSILWLKDNDGTESNTRKILSRIRASIEGMVTEEEYNAYCHEGLLSSKEQLYDILDMLARFLEHKHNRRCLVPRRGVNANEILRVTGGNERTEEIMKCYVCKVPDNRLLSNNPNIDTFIQIELNHDNRAVKVLEQIGLAHREGGVVDLSQHGGQKECMILDECLLSKRHIPPTTAQHGIISSVLAKLIIINPNNDNVQYLDSYGVSKYLVKYVASVDKNYDLYIKPPSTCDPNSITVSSEKIGNTKITSVKMISSKKN
jgi:hypothetical protein